MSGGGGCVMCGGRVCDVWRVCKVKYGTELESKIWIECSNCKAWYHTSCVEVEDNNIPDVFMCFECTS